MSPGWIDVHYVRNLCDGNDIEEMIIPRAKICGWTVGNRVAQIEKPRTELNQVRYSRTILAW